MSVTTPTPTPAAIKTLAGVLDDPPDTDAAADQSISRDFVAALGQTGTAVVRRKVAESVSRLLRVDVAEILLTGWERQVALAAAARDTAAQHGSVSEVTLFDRRIDWSRTAHIDVMWSGTRLHRLEALLTATAVLVQVAATVTAGRLVALCLDDVELSAELRLDGRPAGRGVKHLDPNMQVDLGRGISLVGGTRAVA